MGAEPQPPISVQVKCKIEFRNALAKIVGGGVNVAVKFLDSENWG
jgi:hypothetical protein